MGMTIGDPAPEAVPASVTPRANGPLVVDGPVTLVGPDGYARGRRPAVPVPLRSLLRQAPLRRDPQADRLPGPGRPPARAGHVGHLVLRLAATTGGDPHGERSPHDPAMRRRATPAADAVAPLLEALLGPDVADPRRAVGRLGDRPTPTIGDAAASCRPTRMRRMLWMPNEVGLARAYVSGELELDGDIFVAVETLRPGVAPSGARRGPVPSPPPSPPPGGPARSVRRCPTARGGPAVRPAPLTRARLEGDQPPLRRRQRVLRARARAGDDLLVRPLHRSRDRPRGRTGGQARAHLPQARSRRAAWRPTARRRLRVGIDGHPRRRPPRRPRRRHHDQRGRRPSSPGSGSQDAGVADRVEIRLQDYRELERRDVRRHLLDRHVRARRQGEARHVLRPAPRRCCDPTGRLLNHAISVGRRLAGRPRARSSAATCSPTASSSTSATASAGDGAGRVRGARRRVAARALRARRCGRGWPTSRRTGTGRSSWSASRGRGSGASTWPARRSAFEYDGIEHPPGARRGARRRRAGGHAGHPPGLGLTSRLVSGP